MTYLICYLHPLQPFSKEAKAEAEAEPLKKIGLEAEVALEANCTGSTSLLLAQSPSVLPPQGLPPPLILTPPPPTTPASPLASRSIRGWGEGWIRGQGWEVTADE